MTDSKLSTLSSPRAADQRIISLVKQISESKDRKVPSLLLALRPIIKEYPANTQVGIKLRQEIWQYNLLKVMILILKQDFAVIEGEWETASELATLLSHIIVGLVLDKNDKRQLETDHLPKSVESILLLARHISNILTEKSPTQRLEQSNLSVNLKQVFDALLRLCSGHINLIGEVLTSQWLLLLLVSDSPQVANVTMETMEKLLRLDPHALHTLEESTVFTLLDELIYKLTVNTDKSVAQTACRCLVKFCESSNKIVQSLGTRYIGLRPLLRRWDAKGFDRDLRHIILLLESGSVVKAKNQRQQECAKYIQAIWRGYSARKKLRRADHAFAKFQKSYRLKKAKEEQVKLQTQYQSELYHQMKMRRQQLLRTLDEKRLKALEILPASQVEKYLQKEKSVAATRIQTLWRGHRERSKLTQRQMVARQVHAAIIIQRAYRKWLEKASISDQAFPTYLKPQGLTDIRRTELTKQINEWNEQNPTKIQTQEELEAIHKRAQELLVRHYQNIRPYRKLEYQCENMMARLDTDMELIQLAPRLQDVTQKDIDMYSSRSLPVATVAKQQHNETLRRLQQPWWKVLGMEEVEVNEDENDRIKAEIFLDNLGI
ncbi:IQ calmodulin-binding motif-containing protein 1 [Biomphalaria glabrata]|nr:IQ calmodulin-binding motif-containing protein 1 [Biomphalaria glabrata]